jgi:hypothetical protein
MSVEDHVRAAGARYHRARRRADTELDRIAGLLLDHPEVSVNGAAIDTDIPRSTLLRRMDALRDRREQAARPLPPRRRHAGRGADFLHDLHQRPVVVSVGAIRRGGSGTGTVYQPSAAEPYDFAIPPRVRRHGRPAP